MLKPQLNELGKLAKDKHIENKKYFDKLKKKAPKNLDYVMQDLHDAEFKKTDCLECANCCKTTPALISNEDINRIANHLRISTKDFIAKYVTKDSDGDTILKKTPCIFLNTDNTCSIYEVRPFACKDYPHTHRKKMQTILNLTVKNAEICPAVARILQQISTDILE